MRRWRGWWRIVSADQWGVFFAGAMLGMVLPGGSLCDAASEWQQHSGARHGRGARVGRRRAVGSHSRGASWRCWRRGFCSRRSSTSSKAWCARSPTSSGPAAIARARWSRGDVRVVYYGALGRSSACGASSRCGWRSPSCFDARRGNIAGTVFTIASLHLLYSTPRLLPRRASPADVAPRRARRHVLFYGFFTVLSIRALL